MNKAFEMLVREIQRRTEMEEITAREYAKYLQEKAMAEYNRIKEGKCKICEAENCNENGFCRECEMERIKQVKKFRNEKFFNNTF